MDPNTERDERVKAPERLTKQVCPDGFVDCRAHPASSLRKVEYARVDQPPDATEQFERLWAGCAADPLKADQMSANYWFLQGRYYETLSGDSAATRMCDLCVEKVRSIADDYRRLRKDNANIIAHHLDEVANQLESLTLDQVEQEK